MRVFDGYIYRQLVEPFSEWSYFEGEAEPSGGTLDWTTNAFDDADWFKGNDGFGYDTALPPDTVEPLINTDVPLPELLLSSLYIRKNFTVSDLSEIGKLELAIDYDDSFVAYINGVEVHREGVPGEVGVSVPFDSLGASHESTNANGSPAPIFTIALSDFPNLLNPGDDNVLAIQGLNTTLDSSDFFLGQIGLAGLAADAVAPTGDFDNNGILDAADIDALTSAARGGLNPAEFDLNADGLVNGDDRLVWINDIKNTYLGDSDMDGEFGTKDFVTVFTAGQYEDATPNNSTWATGDWNGDGDFGTPDFVAAFTAGGYEKGPKPGGPNAAAVPEPSSLVLIAVGILSIVRRRRR
jgi:hypothetical protein